MALPLPSKGANSSRRETHQLVSQRGDADSVVVGVGIDDGESPRISLDGVKHQRFVSSEVSHLELGALGLGWRVPTTATASPSATAFASSSSSTLAPLPALPALCSFNDKPATPRRGRLQQPVAPLKGLPRRLPGAQRGRRTFADTTRAREGVQWCRVGCTMDKQKRKGEGERGGRFIVMLSSY